MARFSKRDATITTPSSAASGPRTAVEGPGIDSARSNNRASSSRQKYCERKSSCRQTICAPRPAASRIRLTACSRLFCGSAPEAFWTRPILNDSGDTLTILGFKGERGWVADRSVTIRFAFHSVRYRWHTGTASPARATGKRRWRRFGSSPASKPRQTAYRCKGMLDPDILTLTMPAAGFEHLSRSLRQSLWRPEPPRECGRTGLDSLREKTPGCCGTRCGVDVACVHGKIGAGFRLSRAL